MPCAPEHSDPRPAAIGQSSLLRDTVVRCREPVDGGPATAPVRSRNPAGSQMKPPSSPEGDRSARDDALAALDATAQAELVRRREIAPRDLVAAACERITRIDSRLGAVPVRFFDRALEAADRVSSEMPFAAVPFLMKDVGARQAGQPYYAGNRALRDAGHAAAVDTPLGARFRELGLVTVGNSSTPEFGLQSNTWPLAYGPTHNPWDPARSAGGSSGGACAAVAAGLVPVAHASDGAGSIRIPAAWCGLVGLKPSRDRIAWRYAGKNVPEVEFVVARSLRDTAAFLDALRPATERRSDPHRFASSLSSPPAALRVGLCVRSPDGSRVRAECGDAAQRTAHVLGDMGHRVEESAPESLWEYEERSIHGAFLGADQYRACLAELEERLDRRVGPDDVEPFLWELSRLAESISSPDEIDRAATWIAGWVGRILGWFERFDLLVTPTVCEPAPLLEGLDPGLHDPMDLLAKMIPHMAFTEPWNATGQPAITLPAGFSSEGLPVGVQLVAAPGREDVLLSVSAAVMAELPAARHRPRIHA